MLRFRWFYLGFALLLATSVACGQNTFGINGVPPYTVQIPVPLGFISATTGHPHQEIPIASIPERNGDPLIVKLVFEGSRYYYTLDGWLGSGGWSLAIGTSKSGTASIGSSSSETCAQAGDTGYPIGNVTTMTGFYFTELDNTVHASNNSNVYTKQYNCYTTGGIQDPNPGTPTASGGASDGSGYTFKVSNYTQMQWYAPDGTLVYDNTNDGYSLKAPMDTNGNYESGLEDGQPDTLGRSPITLSGTPYCWGPSISAPPPTSSGTITILSSSGTQEQYILNCTAYPISIDNNGTTETETVGFLTSLVLPDKSQYTFTYDTGSTPNHLGDLLTMTLPTGGEVSYTYVMPDNVNYAGSVTSATFGGGTWSLTYTLNSSLATTTTLLAPPRYDSPTKSYISDQTKFTTEPEQNPFLASVQYYTGTSNLLKTISFTYDADFLPLSMTTTLNDSGQTSQITYQYLDEMRDYITQKQETDFNGNIIRTTTAQYNGPYFKPSQINVYTGAATGSPTSSTLYTYDEYSASYCKNGVSML
jgi:hypothetical protein